MAYQLHSFQWSSATAMATSWSSFFILVVLAPLVCATQSELRADANTNMGITMEGRPPEQSLRVCNAYTTDQPVHVYRANIGRITGKGLMYKECRDFVVDLREDEELEFKDPHRPLGVFTATGIPEKPSQLLLVAHRRGPGSNAMAFQSHMFLEESDTPQVAVIDAYRGPLQANVLISDIQQDDKLAGKNEGKVSLIERAETLTYANVFNIGEGLYNVSLTDPKGTRFDTREVALTGQRTFALLRVGNGVQNGEFGQDLVVYGATAARSVLVALAASLLATARAAWFA